MRPFLSLFLCLLATTGAHTIEPPQLGPAPCSVCVVVDGRAPFCGFFLGGGVGWDSFTAAETRSAFDQGSITDEYTSHAMGFSGELFLGWSHVWCRRYLLSGRVGYAGQIDNTARFHYYLQGENQSGAWRKEQGLVLDFMPGMTLGSYAGYVILGAEYDNFLYKGQELAAPPYAISRSEKEWLWAGRIGAGFQYAFCNRASVGLDYTYIFYAKPTLRPTLSDPHQHKFNMDGHKVMLTATWWVY